MGCKIQSPLLSTPFTRLHAPLVMHSVQRKLASHLAACRSAGVDFVLVVAETLDGLAEETTGTIRAIGKAISQRVASAGIPARVTRNLIYHPGMCLSYLVDATGVTQLKKKIHVCSLRST